MLTVYLGSWMIKRVIEVFLSNKKTAKQFLKLFKKTKPNRRVISWLKIGLPKLLMCGMWTMTFGLMPDDASVLKEYNWTGETCEVRKESKLSIFNLCLNALGGNVSVWSLGMMVGLF